jgi:hypothetical protein
MFDCMHVKDNMLRRNYAVITTSLGTLLMLVALPVCSRDQPFPYSPNEIGEYVAVEPLAPPLSIARGRGPSQVSDLPPWGIGTRYTPMMIFPYSPNETGQYRDRPLP